MSSVQDENKSRFRNLLIRQASLDKIKCTACSTLGSIFSKESSLIHILEKAMNSSRTYFEVPIIKIMIPSIHIICVAMSLIIGLIRKHYYGGMSFENLDKFIMDLNQLKSKRRESIQQMQAESAKTDKLTEGVSAARVEKEIKSPNSTQKHKKVFYDAKATTVEKRDYLLTIGSLASIAFVYIQLSLLFYMIGLSVMKVGLLFMLICVSALAYFTLKISFAIKLSDRRSSRRLKSVRHKLIGKALTLQQITYVLPQIFFNSCGGGKFSTKKPKSS